MIGDSWEIDIMGALNFGIDQVMFLNNLKNELPDSLKIQKNLSSTPFLQLKGVIKTYFIEEIKELPNVL